MVVWMVIMLGSSSSSSSSSNRVVVVVVVVVVVDLVDDSVVGELVSLQYHPGSTPFLSVLRVQ